MKPFVKWIAPAAAGAALGAGCVLFRASVPAELENPALPPVTVLGTPGGDSIELVKDGKLQFVLVGDFKKERKITGP